MLNLRETYYNSEARLPGTETSVGTRNVTAVNFRSDATRSDGPLKFLEFRRGDEWPTSSGVEGVENDDHNHALFAPQDIRLDDLGSSSVNHDYEGRKEAGLAL